jgi:hypothetical protein
LSERIVQEKRAYIRFGLWFPVIVEAAGGTVAAVCDDASSGGLLIASSGPVEIGAEVTVTFRVTAEGEERIAKGRVVRMEQRTDNPRAIWSHSLAIEFLEAQPELQELFKLNSSPPPPLD